MLTSLLRLIFQYIGKVFRGEFEGVPTEYDNQYVNNTFKDMIWYKTQFFQDLILKSSKAFLKRPPDLPELITVA